MKKYVCCAILVLFPLLMFPVGNGNVVERSNVRIPSWIDGMYKNYIITTATGKTMEDARKLTIDQVRSEMISSVAIHVVSDSHYKEVHTQVNKHIDVDRVYVQNICTKAASIPFLHNVSASNVEEYYWEKVEKENGEFEYHYSVKYPFSEAELKALIAEFVAREQELDNQITWFNRQFTDWEDLLSAEVKLKTFCAQLPMGDDWRLQQCKSILDGYRYRHKDLLCAYLAEKYQRMPADGFRIFETPTDTILVSIVTLISSPMQTQMQMDRVASVKATRQASEVLNSGAYINSVTQYTETETSVSYSDKIVAKFMGMVKYPVLAEKFPYMTDNFVYIFTY